jgi:hypothetical protein
MTSCEARFDSLVFCFGLSSKKIKQAGGEAHAQRNQNLLVSSTLARPCCLLSSVGVLNNAETKHQVNV